MKKLPKLDDRLALIPTAEEPLLFEKSKPGRVGYSFSDLDVPLAKITDLWNSKLIRNEVKGFPEISENEVIRHFVRLSQKNYAIDLGLYPLGSCTMKYNPKINEELAKNPILSELHPLWPEELIQPALKIQFEVQRLLTLLTGLDAFTLQPSAGAHGEYTGMKVIQAYHRLKSNHHKTKVLIPESAHGTNPATCSMIGYEIVSIPTNPKGVVEIEDIKPLIDESVAGIMMTNPNTLGLFETHIKEIADLIHSVDGLFYMDGANFNAILGITRPADLGVDIMHINLHKTFSTPHGGGGPGAGAVGATEALRQFLPTPQVEEKNGVYHLNSNFPHSIGRVGGFNGNFAIHIRALAYLLSIGSTGNGKDSHFRMISEAAVINANYIKARLKDYFNIPFNDDHCMHEILLSDQNQQIHGIKTLDIAKRLMDYGYHPMTVYFPLVVSGAMLIEPTESETKEALDEFCDAMISIAKEAQENKEVLLSAPHFQTRGRVDELLAQKKPRLRWTDDH